MTKPLLILIGGAPATGKTTLGRRIADEFSLPFIAKDAIKERLFDTLGWSNRAWSQRIGPAAFELLYDLIEMELRAGVSCIAEGNFYHAVATQRLQDIQRRYDFALIQITCICAPTLAVERFRARWESGLRHPGHVEDQFLAVDFAEQVQAQLARGVYAPLDLDGTNLTLDTNDLAAIDYASILTAIQQAFHNEQPYP